MPDVASISAAAGVSLFPDVLTVARFPAFVGVPGVVSFSAIAFIHAVAGVSAVDVVTAVDGVFDVASFSVDPGPYVIVAGIFTYCTIQAIYRLSD